MRSRTLVITSLLVVMYVFVDGCDRYYGPRFVNETDTSASIVLITTETDTLDEGYRFKIPPGVSAMSSSKLLQPREIVSIKITYGEDKTITFNREYLEKKLTEIGGADKVVFLIRSDGVQLISEDEYWRDRRKSG